MAIGLKDEEGLGLLEFNMFADQDTILDETEPKPIIKNQSYVYQILLSHVDQKERWEIDEIENSLSPLNEVFKDDDALLVWMFVKAGSPLTALYQSFVKLRDFVREWKPGLTKPRHDGMEDHLRRFEK